MNKMSEFQVRTPCKECKGTGECQEQYCESHDNRKGAHFICHAGCENGYTYEWVSIVYIPTIARHL